MTTSTITPAIGTDWTAITSFRFRFRFAEHAQYPGINGILDNAYSYELIDPDDFFVDAEFEPRYTHRLLLLPARR